MHFREKMIPRWKLWTEDGFRETIIAVDVDQDSYTDLQGIDTLNGDVEIRT